jgi:hypothetical protein
MAFRNSPVHGQPGFAWLDIDAAVGRDVTFRLSCPNRSSATYLGPSGWQGSPHDWRPVAIAAAPAGARLQVGPPIVDRLQEDVLVRIEIPSTGYRAEASWDYVPPSNAPFEPVLEEAEVDDGGVNVRIIDTPPPVEAAPQRPVVRPQPPRPPVVETPPNGGETSGAREPEIVTPPPPRPEVAAPPAPAAPQPATAEARPVVETGCGEVKSGRLMAVAALVAGLAAGTAAGYVYVTGQRIAASGAAAAAAAAPIDEAARLLAARQPQPERLFRVGAELHDNPNGSRDVGLQAVRRAAELDYVPAKLWLARTADPARHEWKSARAKPDGAASLAAYAAQPESGEAASMRSTLCAYLRGAGQMTDADQRAVDAYCR